VWRTGRTRHAPRRQPGQVCHTHALIGKIIELVIRAVVVILIVVMFSVIILMQNIVIEMIMMVVCD
jgi:hypothetical protein